MKKKLLMTFAIICISAFATGVTACATAPDGATPSGDNGGHTHVLTYYPAKAADCETSGNIEYYVCACGKYFKDENAKIEIGDKTAVTINATGHSYSNDWSSDETNHWHAATCKHSDEISDKAKHSFDGGVCTVCNYLEPRGLIYTQYRTGYAVSGYEGTDTKIVVPATHDGRAVLSIGIAGGDGFAFCSNVTEIVLPDTIQYIQNESFSYCTKLEKVTVPSCLSIGGRAFAECTALQEIILPDNVTNIGEGAFYGCSKLSEIRYTGDIAGWCDISGLYSLMYYDTNDKKLYINNVEITGELIIPDGVTSIGSYAFSGCSNLTSVTIPNSVTYIGDWTFDECSGLTSITFNGTKAQWNSIQKGLDWNYNNWNSGTGDYTVYCTDGEIAKSEDN